MIDLSNPHKCLTRWGFIVVPEITLRCNVVPRCPFCNNKAAPGIPSDMTVEILEQIVEQCMEVGTQRISLTGGEPLIHPDTLTFLDMMESAKSGLSNFATNGDLLTDDMLQKVLNTGCERISISYYDKSQKDKITRLLWMLDDNDIYVNVNSVLTPENYDYFEELVCEAAEYDCVKTVCKFNPHPFSFVKDHDVTDALKDAKARDLFKLQQQLKDQGNKTSIWLFERPQDFFALTDDIPGLEYRKCGACRGTYIGVTPEGNVRLCAYRIDPVIGNVMDTTLKELEKQSEKWFKQTLAACPHTRWIKKHHPEVT